MKIRYKMGICILHVMQVWNILIIWFEIWRKKYGRNGNGQYQLLHTVECIERTSFFVFFDLIESFIELLYKIHMMI